ncbi:Uncharacterized conserved protein [Plasmopara halstedii]|uniref:Uncharacterized conserved protein n=1 Tax=Plasmopara halstedii TaxID=4781 RepID=A0A0N7L6Y2_PLAHL|nr:Uncharacterized conserved protein [Plasmopara halstedii]CEG45547.1 Uncharacterized conserved protein [Plasmopara halstedii]|eukprot:XP_024581916.1 Uncharacterized conserved protein [Plasmopara halstedii]
MAKSQKKSRRYDKKQTTKNRKATTLQIRAAKSQTNAIFSLAASSNPNPKNIGPFSDSQRILVVGDGDFSFSLSLAVFLGGKNLVATCYDSELELKDKYPNALLNCDALDTAGAEVHFDVDATNLKKEKWLDEAHPFHMIVFNFPHLGGGTEEDVTNNQKLLKNFFYATREFLHPDRGHVLVSLRNTPFYRRWKIQEQAAASGFQLRRTEAFNADIYSGYEAQRTHPASFRGEPPSTAGSHYYFFALDKSYDEENSNQQAYKKPKANDLCNSNDMKKEIAKIKRGASSAPSLRLICQPCGLTFRDTKKYNGHLNSAKHAKKVKALKKKF